MANHNLKRILPVILLSALFKLEAYGQEQHNDSAWIASTYNYLLMVEADSGNIDKVKTLLGLGANPNTCDANGVTPLMFAIQSGHTKIATLLIEKGADINASPYNGNTSLHAAIHSLNDTIAELLIEKGADINAKNHLKLTPLHLASWYGLPFITELLLYKGAKPNEQDYQQNTPLMLATHSGAKRCSQILLKYGADPNATDRLGRTPLMVAAQFNDTSIAKTLLKNGADITATDINGSNALCYAIKFKSNDVLELLLNTNAYETQLSKSYYQIAWEHNNIEAIKRFSQMGLKTKFKPNVSSLYFGTGFLFAQHEFLWGFQLGGIEQVTQTDFSIGYFYRPFKMPTLKSINGQLYQFWEYRNILQTCFSKYFYLLSLSSADIKAFLGFNMGLEFRNYRGTFNDPKTALGYNLNSGLSVRFDIMEYLFGFGYRVNNDQLGINPYRYSLTIKFHLNTLKPKITRKHVNYI